jgi:hypothetical protein
MMMSMQSMIRACEADSTISSRTKAHEIYKQTLALQLRADVLEKKQNKNFDFNIILSPEVFETPLKELHALIEKKDWTNDDITKLAEYDRKIGRWQADVLQDERCCNVCCESEAKIACIEKQKEIIKAKSVHDMQMFACIQKAVYIVVPIVGAICLWYSMKSEQSNDKQATHRN